MNILGHGYITIRVFSGLGEIEGGGNGKDGPNNFEKDLIIGALLPESCPFIADNPFTFEEIHEGGEVLLKFLKEKYPERIGLALGMLSHGVKYGADGFNQEIERYASDKREELLVKIASAFNIRAEDTPKRLHNVLWAGVDFWLLEKHPDLVGKVQQAIKAVDVMGVAQLLAGCFGKDVAQAEAMAKELFKDIYRAEEVGSQEGLIRIGIRHAAGLPEKDRVDFDKALALIKEAKKIMGASWEGLVEKVEKSVGKRTRKFG